jgi:CelD/BcsL family acetyltransferase involved in cellulose biosynthesis
VERALRHLLQPPISWDVLELREIPEDSQTIEAVRAACTRLGLRSEIAPDSESPFLPIDSDWETFFATRFGRERRQQMRRKARRLEATAQPTFSVINEVEGDATALERLMAVQQDDSYRGETRNSIFGSEAKRAFFGALAASFSRRGWLRLGVLELGGRPAAFRFSFEYAGTYYDYYHGFDRGFSAMSPGQALLGHTMQECFRRGLREVDFLRGNEAWKAVWTDKRRRHSRIRVFRPGLRGKVLRLLLAVHDRRRASSGTAAAVVAGADG